MAADFIIAPSGPLTLQDALVITHRVTVSVPDPVKGTLAAQRAHLEERQSKDG